MSRITGYWKRKWRPAVLDALRRRTGVPVPRGEVSAREYAGEPRDGASGRRDLVPVSLPPSEPFPDRTVSGDPALLEQTLARITNQAARSRYLLELRGGHTSRDEEFVAVIDGARAAHTSGMVITPDDRLLLEATGLVATTDNPTNPLLLRYLPGSTRVSGCMAVVTCSMPYNYYHWLMEALPRVALYERAGVRVDRYFAPTDARYQRETLGLLGLGRDRIERATRNRHVVADRLAASSWDSPAARFKTDFLHQRLTSRLDADAPQSGRIFVSRRWRGKRMIVNDREVFAALQPWGFRRVCLETMSVTDQIALFHGAECVVGPHGAGLTNVVFCRPGAKVLEVNTPYRTTSLFYALARYRQIDYHLHVADPVQDRFSNFDAAKGVGDSNMRVQPAVIAALVRDLLDGKPMPSMLRSGALRNAA